MEEVTPGRYVTVSRGVRVPYPEPTSAAATKIGKANKRTDTRCEQRVRSELHRLGLRFRKDLLIRTPTIRVRPDVVFTRRKVAVFIDGCFWHGCPEHQNMPRTNRSYWVPKMQANRDRDARVDVALQGDGWRVLRFWEHEAPEEVAITVADLVRRSGSAVTPPP